MEVEIEFKASDEKDDWFSNHVLTKEQLAQLIHNKFERATYYQRKEGNAFFDE
jgi:hypothetical protein